MPFLDDIWITLSPQEMSESEPDSASGYDPDEIRKAIDVFHRSREAKADYEIIPPGKSPLPLTKDQTGVVAVAATLGEKVDLSADLPGMEPCLKAALSQLQAYLNYRIMKRLSPQKLHLGWPVVPGGAVAPDLTQQEVLDLLPEARSGVRIKEGRLLPSWSLVYLYPMGPKPDEAVACASCHKDCTLRK